MDEYGKFNIIVGTMKWKGFKLQAFLIQGSIFDMFDLESEKENQLMISPVSFVS